jgi:hypothetical protein
MIRRGAGVLAMMAAMLGAAGTAHAATFSVGLGVRPTVVADPDGTAHVAFAESNSAEDAGAQIVRYCRIPAGASACDRTQKFVIGPSVSVGAAIVRDPGTGALHIAINEFDGPGGVQDGLHVRTSTDGGQTWQADRLIGTGLDLGLGDAVFGPGAFRVTASDTIGAGHDVQAAALSGPATSGAANGLLSFEGLGIQLGNVDATTVLAIGRETARSGRLVWRQFTGNANPNVAANWTPQKEAAAVVSGADLGSNGVAPPAVAGFEGASSIDEDLVVRRYDKATNAFGPPAKVADTPGGIFPAVDVDAAANVHAFWSTGVVAGTPGNGRRLVYAASVDGATWPSQPVVLQSSGVGATGVRSAAGLQGVGVAVWAGGDADVSGEDDRIYVANIGGPASMPAEPAPPAPPAPPGGTGGSGQVPSPKPACAKVPQLGVAQLVALTGCFAGTEPKLSITTPFLVNGVKVDPKGQSATIDLKARTLEIPSKAVVSLDPVVIAKGKRTWTFPATGTYTAPGPFDLDAAGFGAELLGLDVLGDADLRFTAGASALEAHLTLPAPFAAVRPDITLRGNNQVGLRLDGLKIDEPVELPFGFRLNSFEYVADPPTWKGAVEWTPPLPTGGGDSFGGAVSVVDGSLERLAVFGRFPGGKTLFPPYVFLNRAGVELTTKPDLQLKGDFVVSGGPGAILSVGRLGDAAPQDRLGTVALTLGSPLKVAVDGEVFLFGFKLGQGYLRYTYPLDIGFGADAQIGSCDLQAGGTGDIGAAAKFDGFLAASKGFAFSLEAAAKICYGLSSVSGSAVLSSKGVAGCGTFGLPDPTGITEVDIGVGYLWSKPAGDIDLLFGACSVAPYRAAVAARAAQAGTSGFAVGTGLRQLDVLLTGAPGAPPAVTLVAPDGRRLEQGTGAATFPTHLARTDVANGTATFVVARPPAGAWRIEPRPGSPAVAKVDLARDAPDAVVRGTVRVRGARRELRYTRRNAVAGERVTFVAEGGGTVQALGVARGTRGTLRFTPRPGPGGRRTVFAVVERGGMPIDRQRLATFQAPPPPRPGRAGRLRTGHRSGRVTVAWTPGRNLVAQEVLVRLTDGTGRVVRVGRRTRTLRIPDVRDATTGTVTVTGVARDGRRARAASARVAKAPKRRAGRRRG